MLGLVQVMLSAPVVAQTADLPSRSLRAVVAAPVGESPARELDALRRWTREYAEWHAWFLQWRSRPEPGLFMSARARRPAPVPPSWLGDACAGAHVDAGPIVDACRAFAEWNSRNEPAQLLAEQAVQAHAQREAPARTLWWERIHVDGLWPMTRSGSSAIGVAGMHSTMQVGERMQVFLAPGLIMMRVPTLQGQMTWSPATDWGFSYRLTDFRLPGMRRASSLHLNFVRVWLLGQHAIVPPGEMYLAGCSITFRKR
jgi:hypothetical protein